MNAFKDICFFPDGEVPNQLLEFRKHPMTKILLDFSFPNKTEKEIDTLLNTCKSTQDFQKMVLAPAVQRLLSESSKGLSWSGFEHLEKGTAYLYISNHRDIVLDTTLVNYALLKEGRIMTASAIGDNLVHNDFLLTFAKLNRNFLVKRNLPPREMLMHSKELSSYIAHLIQKEQRSVWIAQREGRAKDGHDTTQKGVLKMLSLAKARKQDLLEYIQALNIVPIAISYELDPTDQLKTKELLALEEIGTYEKQEGEDFKSIMTGLLGNKGRIHIQIADPLNNTIHELMKLGLAEGKLLQELASLIDQKIHQNYHLWPNNYIASDLLTGKGAYSEYYTQSEKELFEDRLDKIQSTFSNSRAKEIFLSMYANPVQNK